MEKEGAGNKHQWTMFVAFENDLQGTEMKKYVEEVTYKLHPTFNPPSVTIKQPPYTLKRIGWGTFNIEINIKWKKEIKKSDTVLDHYLVFSGNGKS